MVQFITVTVINHHNLPKSQFICTHDSVFSLTWILEHSDTVIAFEVSENGRNVDYKHYKFGSFDKWVLSFTKEHYEQS